MKSLSTLALILLGAIATAQTDAWSATRFGLNIPAPDLFGYQSPSDYKNFAYNEGKADARFNNSKAIMSGTGVTPSVIGHSWGDPLNHDWADIYELTDLLPKNTWVRVPANLQNHFPNPVNYSGQLNRDRNTYAIINRIMFRGTDLSNGLNILWNITPSVYPNPTPTDSWSTITTNPSGVTQSVATVTGDPSLRDWWRPMDEYLPYLKAHVQTFVWDVNDMASNITKQRSSGTITENFIARMGFQMGNEPAAGHPGGSINGQVGSWDGVGRVLEGTTSTTDFRPRLSNLANNQVPAGFGSNPCTMPAFSMFGESVDSYRLNYIKGQLRNIQWSGSAAPAVNEIGSYGKEMTGKAWPTVCGRRALHFNSPTYRWKFNVSAQYNSTNPDDMLASSLIDPKLGRWETPQEYAKRWVVELEKQVNIVAALPMPGSAKVVDITECYLTGAESGGVPFNPGAKFSDGTSPDYSTMTFDQVRQMSKSFKDNGTAMVPLEQPQASRESLLAAIRTELYNRDMAGTLTPNLGKIFWWGAGWPDPRMETGLANGNNNEVTGYNPWGDFRLTLSEVKAIFGR